MSYHSSRWWAYCLIFAFACQLLLVLPGAALEFQGRHLAHAPEGERSDRHVVNETCSFRGDAFTVEEFTRKAAVECYMYTNGLREEHQKKVCYKARYPKICLNCTDTANPNEADCHLPNIDDENSPLFRAFRTKAIGRLWANCVREAIACCRYMRYAPHRTDLCSEGFLGAAILLTGLSCAPALTLWKRRQNWFGDSPQRRRFDNFLARCKDGVYCNRTWDGLTCYEDTDANRNVSKVCPRVLYIYSKPHCEYYSTRWCHENGSWYRLMNQQRTFYTSCAPKPWEYVGVYHYSIGLFTLSVLSLIPALVIFNWYKSLQVPRITIHKHLCFAVMMCGVMYIIDHSIFTLDDVKPTKYTKNLTHSNTWWCKLLSVLNRYFMVSQFTWMLCEGCYLHRLVALAFSKQLNLKLCYAFGWGLPAVLVIIYSSLRATQSDDRCWRNIVVYDYTFTGPILACLAVNIFFMIHVIYILVTKLRQRNVNDTENFRKILRAVVILIPVFGVHFVLTTFVSPSSCSAYLKKLYAEWGIVGLQGFFVSLIFCYLNSEIQSLLKRSYNRYKNDRSLSRRHRPSVPQTTTTTTTTHTTPM